MTQDKHWMVISHYSDGDQIIEGKFTNRSMAELCAKCVRIFREDQDEMPVVFVVGPPNA